MVKVEGVEKKVEKDDSDVEMTENDEKVEIREEEKDVETENLVDKTCRKVEGRCRTHGVDLVSRRSKTRVWRKSADGLYRNVYRVMKSEVCPEFSGISGDKITKPLGGNSGQQVGRDYRRADLGPFRQKRKWK